MKKLILLELALLFLATTFHSDNPPGWYQQTLPVSNILTDIFFLDSLNGWVVTTTPGYVLKTSDGGNKWEINFTSNIYINVIQLIDEYNGYFAGGDGHSKIFKTTNGGKNWFNISTISAALPILDLSFVNKDTGWICSDDLFDGGVLKTIDGGNNWIRQTEVGDFRKLFFLNKDTGWIYGHTTTQERLYRTINGGTNWELQFVFPQQINDIFFVNCKVGYISSGRMYKTTDGGNIWNQSSSEVGGIKLSFVSDSIGWGGVNFNIISKTLDGGNFWFYQTSPIFNNSNVSGTDQLKAWAGGNGIVHTKDGGGISPIISNSNYNPEKFFLSQNFPNPFNPVTSIIYELRITSNVKIKVFNIEGKEIKELVNKDQISGVYNVEFDATDMPSGVYFYRLEVTYDHKGETYSDTKKMILIR